MGVAGLHSGGQGFCAAAVTPYATAGSPDRRRSVVGTHDWPIASYSRRTADGCLIGADPVAGGTAQTAAIHFATTMRGRRAQHNTPAVALMSGRRCDRWLRNAVDIACDQRHDRAAWGNHSGRVCPWLGRIIIGIVAGIISWLSMNKVE